MLFEPKLKVALLAFDHGVARRLLDVVRILALLEIAIQVIDDIQFQLV